MSFTSILGSQADFQGSRRPFHGQIGTFAHEKGGGTPENRPETHLTLFDPSFRSKWPGPERGVKARNRKIIKSSLTIFGFRAAEVDLACFSLFRLFGDYLRFRRISVRTVQKVVKRSEKWISVSRSPQFFAGGLARAFAITFRRLIFCLAYRRDRKLVHVRFSQSRTKGRDWENRTTRLIF